MQNVYTLTGRYDELNAHYEMLQAELDAMYEDLEGEVTEETEAMEAKKAEIEALKKEIITEICDHADEYAEIALNAEARRKAAEAELAEFKKQQAAALKKQTAYVNRLAGREGFWKDNFDAAMRIAGTQKIGGAKTQYKHSVYYKNSESIEADEATLLYPYLPVIQSALDKLELPAFVKIDTSVSKSGFKGIEDADLPEGAQRVRKSTVMIR